MEPFILHRGVAVPLLRANIDTDAIIPSREMKRVAKDGLADGLFAGWRYVPGTPRVPDPSFVLNQPPYAGASVLLAGNNFGCGSSREHAVWALKEFGIRAIVAPGYGAIFHNNCVRNGLLPVALPMAAVQALADDCAAEPAERQVTVDLQRLEVVSPGGERYAFALGSEPRQMLLEGLDPIALTLKQAARIDAFQAADRMLRPWIHSDAGVQ
ncbi:3-isopropylmalate dehydratase small subunit [Cupriavidus oxalaticus]|uniref:3-isopropylmalate dehydratase small subunit n=1 Tax=Cupriavidus oxalaticus TaxID=96344 RepID=UPI003F739404